MRIVFDLQACQAPSSRHRGIGRYSMALAKALAGQAASHHIRIVLNSNFPDSVEQIAAEFAHLVPREDIVVFHVPTTGGEACSPHSHQAWRRDAAERIREMSLAMLKPDIVHVASLFEGLGDDTVTSAGSHFHSAFHQAVTLYDLIPFMRQESYLSAPHTRHWYYRKLQGLKNADLLLAISEHTRKEAIASLHLQEHRVVNISSAVDEMFRPLSLPPERVNALKRRYGLTRPFVMYTGGIDPRKNIEGLIQAFARLPKDLQSSYQLAVVCHAQEHDRLRLQKIATQSGLHQHDVIFTGFVTDEDLVALYNLCCLFVFPSLYEGFGLPVLEAMSCGAPVIGSDTSSIPEVISREDALFPPTDLHAMSARIQHALEDKDFRHSLRQHGLEQAKRFSWNASARSAMHAFEHVYEQSRHADRVWVAPGQRRLRLAYVSPLPPEKSGIADYSADLLPELARYYDIDLIVDQKTVDDPWVAANFPRYSATWFESRADSYDRIVYHFGNSSFHQHMFELLERHPGIVVLHDFFLSGILNYLEATGYRSDAFRNALYHSHGYSALVEEKKAGREALIWKYPCNKPVLERATGVIVHSHFSKSLAETWYGPGCAEEWQIVPLLRSVPATIDREQARIRLGIEPSDFVICSFGMLGPTKLNDRLLAAWLESPLATHRACKLIFVGENDMGPYGHALVETVQRSGHGDQVKVTGFAPESTYRDYLASADMAVQLRSRSRGETSASILDCLAYGIPTIVNENGTARELPEHVLIKLPDTFSQSELSEALVRLWKDHALRYTLSGRAIEYVRTQHHPFRAGEVYRDAIERFAHNSANSWYQHLVRSLKDIPSPDRPSDTDMAAVATAIARNSPAPPVRQFMVDVSELVQRDAKSCNQRVVRHVLHVLLNAPPPGYRVEPVYDAGGYYVYARRFTCAMLGVPDLEAGDETIEAHSGDLFLGLDLVPDKVPQNRHVFVDLRNRGIPVYFVVFDLLPMLRPDTFLEGVEADFSRWLQTVTTVSDGLICNSRAVADELSEWINKTGISRPSPLHIGYFHLGADVIPATSMAKTTTGHDALLNQIRSCPSFLMVGTLEPRKGYGQALDAFEILWAEGADVNFVIVGKQGWMVEQLAERIRTHPQNGRHLLWLEGATDETLINLYDAASALLAASEAEGFGLPLIEAAQHKLPIIARDLPVFREIAGSHAFYFSGAKGSELAEALRAWLKLYAAGLAPSPEQIPCQTWVDSTRQLLDVIEKQQWYQVIQNEGGARVVPSMGESSDRSSRSALGNTA